MIVCVCHVVSERKIRQIVDAGANSVCAVTNACGAGSDCGSCVFKIQRLVQEQKEAESSFTSAETDRLPYPILSTG